MKTFILSDLYKTASEVAVGRNDRPAVPFGRAA